MVVQTTVATRTSRTDNSDKNCSNNFNQKQVSTLYDTIVMKFVFAAILYKIIALQIFSTKLQHLGI